MFITAMRPLRHLARPLLKTQNDLLRKRNKQN